MHSNISFMQGQGGVTQQAGPEFGMAAVQAVNASPLEVRVAERFDRGHSYDVIERNICCAAMQVQHERRGFG